MFRVAAVILVSAIGVGLALPAEAARGTKDCRRMTRQIAHYEGVAEEAERRDNDLWRNATIEHIERLEIRRARICPQYAAQLQKRNAAIRAAKATQELMKKAGKAALRYFTFGAYGF